MSVGMFTNVDGGVFRFNEFLISRYTRAQNKRDQTAVCHQGPMGMGKRMKRSHLRQPRFFHQRDGGFAGGVGEFCGIGFSLWVLGLAWTKFHRLKPMPREAYATQNLYRID